MSGDSKNNQNQIDLLGYHLGLIDENECCRIEADAPDPDALECQCDSVEAWLAPLCCDEFDVPHDLSARIEARIQARRRTLAFNDENAAAGSGKSPFLSGRDLLALAATITLFVGVFLPSFRQVRNQSYQAACASNLRSLGGAFISYVDANQGHVPFAQPVSPATRWYRSDEGSTPGSRNAYELVRGQYIRPESFADPASPTDIPMHHPAPETLHDFISHRNNGYVTPLDWTRKPWTRYEFAPRTPIIADITPLVDIDRRLRPGGPVSMNSPNHGGRGQNVLRMDLSVRYFTSPFAGPDGRDDIYRLQGLSDSDYTGLENPRGSTDAFLTP